jgi:hypothetical protein
MKPSHFALALVVAALLALSAGCSRNHTTTFMAPTGVRPIPGDWTGSITGLLFFDPINTPDLATAPFPPTRLEVWKDSTLVAVDSLSVSTNRFTLAGIKPGRYSLVTRSALFFKDSLAGIRVGDGETDAGNRTLLINSAATGSGMELIGTMPGFRIADLNEGMFPIDVSQLSGSSLGVWNYPSLDYPDGTAIPAGTYHFKFATLWPLAVTNITGWGNPSGGTLTTPVVNHPAVLSSGSATDIVMTFPTTGVYSFTLDERRQTFSVQFLHAAPARAARIARR